MKVGIPRALTYYWFYPFWHTFFAELEIATVLSPPTNKKILDLGTQYAVDETCLSMKLFLGHTAYLTDKVDFIFVPGIKSMEPKRYYCPQIIALPETAKAIFAKTRFLSPEINSYKKEMQWMADYQNFALNLGFDFIKTTAAVEKAKNTQELFLEKCYQGMLFEQGVEALHLMGTDANPINPGNESENEKAEVEYKLAILGNPYLIEDAFINFDLIKKLKAHKIGILIPYQMPPALVEKHTEFLQKDLFWSYPRNIIAAAQHFKTERQVNGFILLNSFGCGTNAILEPYILQIIDPFPLLALTLDEHTGSEGINTRLEAFMDMVRRHQHESCFSLNGPSAHRA